MFFQVSKSIRWFRSVRILALFVVLWAYHTSTARAECVRGFTQVVSDGFGDRFNLYAWSQLVFDDRLYVGTYNEVNGGQIWRYDGESWEMVLSRSASATGNTGFRSLIEFNGYLYAGGHNEVLGAELWRSPDGASWEQVVADGFGSTENLAVRGVEVFLGRLYVGLQNPTTGGQLWRSLNGTSWTPVNQDGFGDPENRSVHTMTTYRYKLYAGTKNNSGLQILRSDNGSDFETVVGPGALHPAGFDLWHNANTQHLYVHNDLLYVGTGNDLLGFSVFRTLDGIHYQPIFTAGMGNPRNLFAWRFFTYNSKLWMGVGNFDVSLGEGASLVRSNDGMDWDTLVGDNGPYFGYGFNDWRNWGVRSFAEYKGDLYIGTAQTWAPALQPFVTGLQVWRWDGCVPGNSKKEPSHTDRDASASALQPPIDVKEGSRLSRHSAGVSLAQNFPNPFNPRTTIEYTVRAGNASVSVDIFDAAGTLVKRLDDGVREPGTYRVEWDGRDDSGRAVASGVYFYRVAGIGEAVTRKMVLLK